MQALGRQDYRQLVRRGEELRATIEASFRGHGLPAVTSGFGSVFSIWFADEAPRTYA